MRPDGVLAGLRDGFGLPGREWSSTSRLGPIALVGLAIALVMGVLVGAGAFAALGHAWGLCLLLLVGMLWVGLNPLTLSTAGISLELVLEGGMLALAVVALGPREALAYWLLATTVLELAQRHYLAVSFINLGVTTLAALAAVATLPLLPQPTGGVATTVVTTGIAVVYTLVEALVSDGVARVIGRDWRAPLPWTTPATALGTGAVLGATTGGAAAVVGTTPAAGLVLLPLALTSRLVHVEGQRRRGAVAAREVVAALTRLASVDDPGRIDEIVVDAAGRIAAASDVSVRVGPAQQHRRVRWYPLAPDPTAVDPVAAQRWLRVEMRLVKAKVSDTEVDALHALAAAARAASARIQEQRRMQREARHDALTGLLNRHGLWDRAGTSTGEGEAVLLVDLDGFKTVNDAHGHARGDEVLVACADEISRALPPGAVAARWGGDEFVVHVRGGLDDLGAERLGRSLVAAVRRASGQVVGAGVVSASVGYATTGPETGVDTLALLQAADRAMYAAKRDGKAAVRGATA